MTILIVICILAILIFAYNKLGNISHIMLAARNNPDPEVIRKMVLMGQNIEGNDELGSYTPLYFAMKYNPNPNVAIMLINLGANINHITLECQTPLLFLLEKKNSNTNIIKLLCDKGAYVSIPDIKGKTALDYAKENNYTDFIDIIKAKFENEQKRIKIIHCKTNENDETQIEADIPILDNQVIFGIVKIKLFNAINILLPFYDNQISGKLIIRKDSEEYSGFIYNGKVSLTLPEMEEGMQSLVDISIASIFVFLEELGERNNE